MFKSEASFREISLDLMEFRRLLIEQSGDTDKSYENRVVELPNHGSVGDGSLKRKSKSPPYGDNDDNNYETMAMIRQQMYGPGGPYYKSPNRKPTWDDLEEQDVTPVVQPPAKTARIDSSYVEPSALMSERSGGTSETFTNQPKSSVTTEHLKHKCTSPHHGDNDDYYETMAMICQQMYGPGCSYYNSAYCKPPRDDLKDKTPVVQPPAMMSERSGGTSETVTNQPKSSVRTEHHKHKCKSPHHGDNDDNNYETMAMIRQQMYGPGGPYYNSANCKPPRDDLEDKTPVVQPPAKTITIDSSYVEPPAMMSERSGGTSEAVTNKPKSSVTKGSRKRQHKSSRDGETVTKLPRDDLEDKTPVKNSPAKSSKVDSSHVEAPAVSEHSGDTSESKLFTRQAKSSVTDGSPKRRRKSPNDGNNALKVLRMMIHKKVYGPGGHYYKSPNRKPPQDDLEEQDVTPVVQPPAKTTRINSSYVEPSALMSECSVGTSETFTNQPKSSVTTEHLKHKCTSPHHGDNDDYYENMAMICQQMYGPGGPYYNFANRKPPSDDLEDKTPVVQPPAKTTRIDSSYVEPPAMMSECSGGPSEAVTNKPKSSVTKGSRKRQRKSSCDGETVTKLPRDDLEDKTPVVQPPAKTITIDSSYVEPPAMMSERSGGTSEAVTNKPKSSVTKGSRKRQRKSSRDGETVTKLPRDDLEDKTPVKISPAKPSKVDSSHVEAPAVSEHSGDTSESKLFTSQAKSSVTDGSPKRRRKSPNDGTNALKVLGMMIHTKLYGPGGRYHDLVTRKRPRGEDEDKKKDSSKPAKKFCSSQDRSDTQPRARGKGKTKSR